MTEAELIARVRAILDGIDRDEQDDDPGWWETSTGVKFGAAKLREVEAAISAAFSGSRQAR